jgi:hypothetical protein
VQLRLLSQNALHCSNIYRRSSVALRQMMSAPVTGASWTDDDLDALKDEIDRVRKERKKE